VSSIAQPVNAVQKLAKFLILSTPVKVAVILASSVWMRAILMRVEVVVQAVKVSAAASAVFQETYAVVMRVVRRDSIASKGYVVLQINRTSAAGFAVPVLAIRMVSVVKHPAICVVASVASESAAMGNAASSPRASTVTRHSALVVPLSVALVAARKDNFARTLRSEHVGSVGPANMRVLGKHTAVRMVQIVAQVAYAAGGQDAAEGPTALGDVVRHLVSSRQIHFVPQHRLGREAVTAF
jgi:hypothetical protein